MSEGVSVVKLIGNVKTHRLVPKGYDVGLSVGYLRRPTENAERYSICLLRSTGEEERKRTEVQEEAGLAVLSVLRLGRYEKWAGRIAMKE